MADHTPVEALGAMRRKAVFSIFERKFNKKTRITVGSATCENAAGADDVYARFSTLLAEQPGEDVTLSRVGCAGKCDMEPVVTVVTKDQTPVKYVKMTPEKVDQVFTAHILGGEPVAEYSMANITGENAPASPLAKFVTRGDQISNRQEPIFGDIPFFGHQLRLTLRNCGIVDPESLDEYLAVMGYAAIARVLESMSPEDVVRAVTEAGLRGRGGGGFPTGLKWKFAAAEPGDTKYIICNADEGDPGAFMDRSTIEGDPHTIIEGMMIGGYAIGAGKGFVYIRAEYPLAIRRIEKAIAAARAAGLLGKTILGSGWSFDLEIRLGAGAFVCGEETALIHSIEGLRGMPRPRPPYPSVSGLWGKPTVINNVETFANIPVIILDGAEWFAGIGTEKSKGTKVFALAGDVANTGLVEVPMGTTLREVVFGVGGGMKDGGTFKAVQTGGPAGGCLPESELDTPIDYDSLARAGSIMGSGGMIVMDNKTCMVDVAKFFLSFTQDESCGKCTPCREGTKRMLEILTRITEGRGEEGDIDKLLRLADVVRSASLCGLGQAAPNPVISTIKHFRDEYEAHIKEKRCPSGACRSLVKYTIDADACVGCTVCAKNCPVHCISGERKKAHAIDSDACIRCGRCFEVCMFEAVRKG
jgi:NADH:ubiquinone oxidoreductase subunit F (NADH-binding)/(2Fe-2S) ferredoxin/NAD-dependent dihydropyrimidine dehydrogenase PreA subunit